MTNLSHVNGLSFLHCMHQRLETLQTQLTLTYTVNTHQTLQTQLTLTSTVNTHQTLQTRLTLTSTANTHQTLQTQLTLTYTVNTHSDPADTINSNLHSEHPSETHVLEKMTMNDLGRQRLD